jgi:hypothetical protein
VEKEFGISLDFDDIPKLNSLDALRAHLQSLTD